MVRVSRTNQERPAPEVSSEPEVSKDMFRIGRRSAVNTSELGLYSDHSEYYNTNVHSSAVRKLVIVTMVIVTVILIGIFLYDFASSASIKSKVNQETKHIYILQNSLKNFNNGTLKKPIVTLAPTIYIVNSSETNIFKDRVDDDDNLEYKDLTLASEGGPQKISMDQSKLRMQYFPNINIHKNALDWQYDKENTLIQNKPVISNHAMIYRIRTKHSSAEKDNLKNNEATPIQFEFKDSQAAPFKHSKYPQLNQYRYPQTSRNIQDIIKYLTSSPDNFNRGIKFTGFYINEKKFNNDIIDTGELAISNNIYENQAKIPQHANHNSDPLYHYRPKDPSEVNLLAAADVRFSPVDIVRYNPNTDPFYYRVTSNDHSDKKIQNDNEDLSKIKYYKKQQKPKPFTLMLDVYPVANVNNPKNKSSAFKSQTVDYESRKPIISLLEKYSNPYGIYMHSSQPIFTQNQQQMPEEDQKHEMILHLNLYPKQKMKVTRNRIIESLLDHTPVGNTKLYESNGQVKLIKRRFKKMLVEQPSTEIKEAKTEICVGSTAINNCNDDLSNTVTKDIVPVDKRVVNFHYENSSEPKNIDTDGYQQLEDTLIAMD